MTQITITLSALELEHIEVALTNQIERLSTRCSELRHLRDTARDAGSSEAYGDTLDSTRADISKHHDLLARLDDAWRDR